MEALLTLLRPGVDFASATLPPERAEESLVKTYAAAQIVSSQWECY